jgi:hypothetical protein
MGAPLDPLRAQVALLANGGASVWQIVAQLTRDRPAEVEEAVLNALAALFVEGAVSAPPRV